MSRFTQIALASSLLCLTSVGAAYAQNSAGFNISGYAELSYFGDTGSAEALGIIDMDIGYALGGAGIGFNLGVDVYAQDSGTYYALFPAVTYDASYGTISAGVPRSVYDHGYMPERLNGTSSILGLELGLISGSYLRALQIQTDDIWPLGVRYDGQFGDVRIGASYHRANDGGTGLNALSLAARYEMQAFSSLSEFAVYGGVDHVFDDSGDSETQFKLGVEGGTDKWMAGIAYSQAAIFGPDIITVYGSYFLNDKITFDALFLSIDSGSSSLYGLGAKYQITDMFYADANVLMSDGASNPLWELTIGAEF